MNQYYKQPALFDIEERLEVLEEQLLPDDKTQFEGFNLSHVSVDYGTPPYIVEAARNTMGTIDLDPASSPQFNKTVRAKKIFTEVDDGLTRPWYGNVYLNPPYSKKKGQSNQARWMDYLLIEYHKNQVAQAVCTVKSALSYNWFETLWDMLPVCLIRQRPSFIKLDGTTEGHASQGAAVFYVGTNVDKFIANFKSLGRITTPDGRYIYG